MMLPLRITESTDTLITTTHNTDSVSLENSNGVSIVSQITTTTPTAKTFDAGDEEVDTLTFETKANTDSGDYVTIETRDGSVYAVSLDKTLTAEIATLTFETKANTDSGDYVVITAQDGTTYAAGLDKSLLAEIATITFEAQADTSSGDYVVVTAQDGLSYACYADLTGADAAPTGAIYVAIPAARKAAADLSAATDAASVAAAFELAFDGLTGFTAKIVTDDTAADGSMLFTQQVKGAVANPVPHNADDSGVGGILVVVGTAGADAVTPTGAAWLAVNITRRTVVDITADTTAAQVAARAETALNAITGFTAKITTDDSAADGTMILTQATRGAVANPDPHNVGDTGVGGIGVAIDTAGADAILPTGAIWTAIAAGNKATADITTDTTAAQVAARVETALNSITGFTAKVTTSDVAANGTMTLTHVSRGPVTDPVPHNLGDTGAGGITVTAGTAGEIDETDETLNKVYIPAHGFGTGLKGQVSSTATLPNGLSAITDYFIIVVDEDYVQFATSLVNALAGTAIDLVDGGTDGATHTFTSTAIAGGSVKPQASHDGLVWADLKSSELAALSQSFTATGNVMWNFEPAFYGHIRLQYTITAGQITTTTQTLIKG